MPPLADECLFLDVNKLKRDGMLNPGYAYSLRWWRNGEESGRAALVCRSTMRIELLYCLEGPYAGEIGLNGREIADILEDRSLDERWISYAVPIVYTTCHFGGWRPWFQCPGSGCGGRRVGKLYLGNRYFLCRHCYGLRYGCQRISDRRMEQLKRSLKCTVHVGHAVVERTGDLLRWISSAGLSPRVAWSWRDLVVIAAGRSQ